MKYRSQKLMAVALVGAAALYSQMMWAQNVAPEGTHDAAEGKQSAAGCLAAGWAADPNDRNIDLQVRVISDGALVAQITANQFRQDLLDAGVCVDGTCSFQLSLFNLISSDTNHSIRVQAQDAQTGVWSDVDGTPKTLNCSGSPEGTHDGEHDGRHSFSCRAEGWAADPNDRDIDLKVRVLSDGAVVAESIANNFRADLQQAGVCPGGTCGFDILLWNRIKKGVPHSITVQAEDAQSGEWKNLDSTPRTLRCYNFNLTVFDPDAGVRRLISDSEPVGQFVPSWSTDGKKLAHTMVGWKTFPTDFLCDTFVTDVSKGSTAILPGAEGGTYASYSPDGGKIVYDRACAGDLSIYTAPAAGGLRHLVRSDARQPEWSPDGRRLVFYQPSDGSLRTVDVNGGSETLLAFGASPAWSPDGHWIAFNSDDLGDIWKIAVDSSGKPLGPAIQLTADPSFELGPSWSADSKTIFFQSEHDGHDDPIDEEFHIWSISASGEDRRELTRQAGMGVDVSASRKGNRLAYGGYQPAPKAEQEDQH